MPIKGIHHAVRNCFIEVQDFLLWYFSYQPSFHHPPQRAHVITEVLKRRLHQTAPTRWNFKSDGMNSVSEQWISHMEWFEKMQTRQLFLLHQDSSGFWRTVTFCSGLSFCIQWCNLWRKCWLHWSLQIHQWFCCNRKRSLWTFEWAQSNSNGRPIAKELY